MDFGESDWLVEFAPRTPKSINWRELQRSDISFSGQLEVNKQSITSRLVPPYQNIGFGRARAVVWL